MWSPYIPQARRPACSQAAYTHFSIDSIYYYHYYVMVSANADNSDHEDKSFSVSLCARRRSILSACALFIRLAYGAHTADSDTTIR